jgi:hypothetical protein
MRIKVYEEQLEDGEKKEVQIYEGVYLEKVDADKRTFLDALPFIPKKRRYNAYEPHCSGLYIGYSRLANQQGKEAQTTYANQYRCFHNLVILVLKQ